MKFPYLFDDLQLNVQVLEEIILSYDFVTIVNERLDILTNQELNILFNKKNILVYSL